MPCQRRLENSLCDNRGVGWLGNETSLSHRPASGSIDRLLNSLATYIVIESVFINTDSTLDADSKSQRHYGESTAPSNTLSRAGGMT